jgi:hypothetical protein
VVGKFPASLNLLWPSAQTTQGHGIVLLNFWLRYHLKRQLPRQPIPEIIGIGHHDMTIRRCCRL